MTYAQSFNLSQPTGLEQANTIDEIIRNVKVALNERFIDVLGVDLSAATDPQRVTKIIIPAGGMNIRNSSDSASLLAFTNSGATLSGTLSGGTVAPTTLTVPSGTAITNASLTTPALVSPAIVGGTIASATISGTTSNIGTLSGGTISAATLSANTLTSTTTNSGTISGGTISGATINNGTLSGTITNSATLSGGTISGATLNNTTFSGTVSGVLSTVYSTKLTASLNLSYSGGYQSVLSLSNVPAGTYFGIVQLTLTTSTTASGQGVGGTLRVTTPTSNDITYAYLNQIGSPWPTGTTALNSTGVAVFITTISTTTTFTLEVAPAGFPGTPQAIGSSTIPWTSITLIKTN